MYATMMNIMGVVMRGQVAMEQVDPDQMLSLDHGKIHVWYRILVTMRATGLRLSFLSAP